MNPEWTASLRTVLACFLPGLACFGLLFGIPAFAQKAAPQKPAGEKLTIDPMEMQNPGPVIWTG